MPYYKVLKGLIDSDRLDYYYRDSDATKVPIAIDISRLTSKFDIAKVDKNYINEASPQQDYGVSHTARFARTSRYAPRGGVFTPTSNKTDFWSEVTDQSDYYIMGIKQSAQKTFEQLSFARTTLYDSVYYHHKVATTEETYRMALELLFSDAKDITFDKPLSYTDSYFDSFILKISSDDYKNELNKVYKESLVSLDIPLDAEEKLFNDFYNQYLSIEFDVNIENLKRHKVYC